MISYPLDDNCQKLNRGRIDRNVKMQQKKEEHLYQLVYFSDSFPLCTSTIPALKPHLSVYILESSAENIKPHCLVDICCV